MACWDALHPVLRSRRLRHCEEGASPTRQSQVGTFDFAGAFPCSGRYCEIAAPCSARLAMTNLGAFPIRRGAAPSLRVPPSRVIARRAQARRGNLKQALTNPPGPSCVPASPARLPRLLRSLAMTSQETCRVRGGAQGGRQGICIPRLKAIGAWGKCGLFSSFSCIFSMLRECGCTQPRKIGAG